MTDQEQRNKWTQDEARWRWAFGLAITLILATAGHLGVGIWWASDITSRVSTVERHSAEDRARLRALASEVSADRILSARLDQRLEGVQADIQRMLRILEGAP